MLSWDGTLEHTERIARQLDLWQRIIEYALAVAVPTVLAVMMFSFFVAPEIFHLAFLAALGAAALTIVPALLAQRLHYLCWSRNTLPQRMFTGLTGMIYISVVSVLSVSLVSMTRGHDPFQPAALAVVGALLLGLIAVMLISSRSRERFENMDMRLFRASSQEMEERIGAVLAEKGEAVRKERRRNRARLVLEERKVAIIIASQPRKTSEVIIECSELSGREVCESVKNALDEN